MRAVTEMDCIIFVGQAEKFAERIGGYVSYQSACYADIKAPDGFVHTLIGPGYSDADEWINGNTEYVRSVFAAQQ